MSGGPGQAAVAGQQGRVERLGQRHIGGVIGGQIVAQFPYARQQPALWISPERHNRKNSQSPSSILPIDLTAIHLAPKDLGDLYVQQVRRMERLTGSG